MISRPNAPHAATAADSDSYVVGPLNDRNRRRPAISTPSVHTPDPRIWYVRAVMAKPLYQIGLIGRLVEGDTEV